MNERSSRAHALFILSQETEHPATGVRLRSRLFLADLGGSEQVKRSKVHHGASRRGVGFEMGSRMREAVNINLGLLALKKVIAALNAKRKYVPYQDSKLTMLLSPALGGDSKASVVICASMEDADAGETLQALRFGEQCANVANDAGQQASALAQLLDSADAEIAELEETIRRKERWEMVETVRADTLAEAGTYEAVRAAAGGGEVVRTSRLVGAERERKELVRLVRWRAELTGEDWEEKLAEFGFGGEFGGKADALGGHAAARFKDHAADAGLAIKGKHVAKWQD